VRRWCFAVVTVALTGVVAGQTPAPAPAAAPAVVLNVGDKAPEFSLPGTDGKTYKLSALRGRTVVLAWYPKAMTRGCTAECKSITANAQAITKFDVAYFMASVDTQEDNKKFSAMEQANFPMLSDTDHEVAMAYGVVSSPTGLASRWTFYIGPDGIIKFIDKAVDPAVTTAGEVLAAKLAELGVRKK
jgi:peroxiredoxin Q/BCP